MRCSASRSTSAWSRCPRGPPSRWNSARIIAPASRAASNATANARERSLLVAMLQPRWGSVLGFYHGRILALGYARLGEGGHLVEDRRGVVDQVHGHGRSGPLAEPEPKVQERHQPQVGEDDAVA